MIDLLIPERGRGRTDSFGACATGPQAGENLFRFSAICIFNSRHSLRHRYYALGLTQFPGRHLWWLVESFEYPDSAKYTEAESGLIYYGYRYYQPSSGRWLSSDPLREIGTHLPIRRSSSLSDLM